MKKEIHRMELRKGDLEQVKEQLMKELERAVEKRDTISVKGRANASNSRKISGKLTEKQLAQKSKELRQSIADTDAECMAVDRRSELLDQKRLELAEQMQDISSRCTEHRQRNQQLRSTVKDLLQDKRSKSLQTQILSVAASMLASGKFDEDDSMAQAQSATESEHEKILELLQRLQQRSPILEADIRQIMLHAEATRGL